MKTVISCGIRRAVPVLLFLFSLCAEAGAQQQAARDAALRTVLDVPEKAKSTEALAEEYAFQYRQLAQSRLNELSQNSAAKYRATDPFGAPMGTTLREDVAKKPGDQMTPQEEELQKIREGFGNAVRNLDIRGVNPGRKEFLCGPDNIFEGDVMDISSGSGIYRVWVVAVKDSGITFMDYRSRQSETIPISLDAPAVPTKTWGASGKVQDAPPF